MPKRKRGSRGKKKFNRASQISFRLDENDNIFGRVFNKQGRDDPFVTIEDNEVSDISRIVSRFFNIGEKENIDQQMLSLPQIKELQVGKSERADKSERGDILQSVYFITDKNNDAKERAFGEIGEILVERKLDNLIERPEESFNIPKFNNELYKRIVTKSFFDFIASDIKSDNFIIEVKRRNKEVQENYLFSNMTKLVKWAYMSLKDNVPILNTKLLKRDINTDENQFHNFSKFKFILILITPNNVYYHNFSKGLIFDYIKTPGRLKHNTMIYYKEGFAVPLSDFENIDNVLDLADMKWILPKKLLIPFTSKKFIKQFGEEEEKTEEVKEEQVEETEEINIADDDIESDIGEEEEEDEVNIKEIIKEIKEETQEQIISKSMSFILGEAMKDINRKSRAKKRKERRFQAAKTKKIREIKQKIKNKNIAISEIEDKIAIEIAQKEGKEISKNKAERGKTPEKEKFIKERLVDLIREMVDNDLTNEGHANLMEGPRAINQGKLIDEYENAFINLHITDADVFSDANIELVKDMLAVMKKVIAKFISSNTIIKVGIVMVGKTPRIIEIIRIGLRRGKIDELLALFVKFNANVFIQGINTGALSHGLKMLMIEIGAVDGPLLNKSADEILKMIPKNKHKKARERIEKIQQTTIERWNKDIVEAVEERRRKVKKQVIKEAKEAKGKQQPKKQKQKQKQKQKKKKGKGGKKGRGRR